MTSSERARKLVQDFGARSDADLSLADIQWLTKNVSVAIEAGAAWQREQMVEAIENAIHAEDYENPELDVSKPKRPWPDSINWLREVLDQHAKQERCPSYKAGYDGYCANCGSGTCVESRKMEANQVTQLPPLCLSCGTELTSDTADCKCSHQEGKADER